MLFAHVRVRSYAPGETIFLMGSDGDSLMAVLSGNVRIGLRSPGGREIALAMIPRGKLFGELTLLDGKERSADARAIGGAALPSFGAASRPRSTRLAVPHLVQAGSPFVPQEVDSGAVAL